MIANLIEAAGPKLTPQTMAAQAPSLGAVGGPGTPDEQLSFRPNNGYWTRDAKLIYWNSGLTSRYNGVAGAYLQVGDRRVLGSWKKSADGQPEGVPVKRQ
jgi:hypothetical protein